MKDEICLKKILLDPASFYKEPEDVLIDKALSLSEKRKVLEQWKYDAILLETASSENMNGGEQAKLSRIAKCIDKVSDLSTEE